jgi:hypothetical protein
MTDTERIERLERLVSTQQVVIGDLQRKVDYIALGLGLKPESTGGRTETGMGPIITPEKSGYV